jgi:adenylate cyclase
LSSLTIYATKERASLSNDWNQVVTAADAYRNAQFDGETGIAIALASCFVDYKFSEGLPMPRFVIDCPGQGSRVFELCGSQPVLIGRSKSNNLVLEDASISRLHAIVRNVDKGKWQIVDQDSANGIMVNGISVKEATLCPADEVVLGACHMRFEEPQVQRILTHETVLLPHIFVRELIGSSDQDSPLSGTGAGAGAPEIKREQNPDQRVRDLERENALLTLLLRVNRALGDLANVADIAERVLDLVLEIEGTDRGYAMLLEESVMGEGDFSGGAYAFQPAILRVRDNSKNPSRKNPPNLIISQSIIQRVMKSGLPLLLTNAQVDPSFAGNQSVVRAGIQSAMCAPLGNRDRRFGLLYVDNLSRPVIFSPEDLDVFAVIAMQAGMAIDRVRGRNEIIQQGLKLGALERFLSPEVAGKVAADAADLRVGGEKQTVTLLFADIRGFTSLAEAVPAEEIVRILNGFFERMTEVVFSHEGTLDKYLGDGLMCLFGAPFSHANDALAAIRAAAEMQASLADLNRAEIYPNLQMGIGIHTGEVIVGYVGTASRMDYTAIGDAVNVAARLTAVAEPDQILVSAATLNSLRETVPARALPAKKLKGRDEPVEVLEILWKELSSTPPNSPSSGSSPRLTAERGL